MTNRLNVIRDKTPKIDTVVSRLFVSHNGKTGYSVNTAIAQTCRPTKGCSVYCYGLEGRLQFPAALRTQAMNAAFFATADLPTIVDAAFRTGRRVLRRQSFIRMFGVGDLQPGSVIFIAALTQRYPTLAVWVSTRKLELARVLPDRSNLHVMLSCDSTTTAKNLDEVEHLVRQRQPQFFAAWVRRGPEEKVPGWIDVVFEEHHVGKGRAKWPPDPRACPATVDHGLSHEGACARCRFCFTTKKRDAGTALVQLRKKITRRTNDHAHK